MPTDSIFMPGDYEAVFAWNSAWVGFPALFHLSVFLSCQMTAKQSFPLGTVWGDLMRGGMAVHLCCT